MGSQDSASKDMGVQLLAVHVGQASAFLEAVVKQAAAHLGRAKQIMQLIAMQVWILGVVQSD